MLTAKVTVEMQSMSEKRFEDFLIEKLLAALITKATPGFRCRRRVPDDSYSEQLIEACLRLPHEHLELRGVSLPYLSLEQAKLLCLSDCSTSHYSATSIAMLR